MTMELQSEFIPYKEAKELKQLGFNEFCLATFSGETFDISLQVPSDDYFTAAPTWRQAFKFFRDKYDIHHSIGLFESTKEKANCDFEILNHDQTISEHDDGFNSYEEAELACLRKLIELAKNIK